MTAPSWERVKELLHHAVALDPQARAKYLDETCGADMALRAELESLLLIGDGLSADFLRSPLKEKFSADGGAPAISPLAAGQIFAQRFQLIRRLGEGGMGQVWLAEQVEPVHRRVALKLIKAGMYDDTVVQRFQAERQSLAIMDHPAIAKVFDAGATPQGQPYFVMEYVPGLSITQYCDQHKLNIRERVQLFIQACDGVQHAHQKAIIHRDLKPANILVVEVDGKPVPRIIDFGLAKVTTPQPADNVLYSRIGQVMGTPGYMSPEQVDPYIQDIDTRTDVYSLGVILYELLAGTQPFEMKPRQRPPLEEWMRRLREEEPRRPSGKVSGDRETSTATAAARGTEPKQLANILRRDLDWITMKALDRDRERRYGSPAELAAELRRYLNDEAVVARPASTLYKLGKFARRHRVAAVAAVVVAVLGLATSGAGLIAVRKQHEAEFQASRALQAQSRLLAQAAAQRLKDFDVAGAQGIMLEILTNPAFAKARAPAAISVFQDTRAADLQLAVLSGHRDRVASAAYSPDGTRIVTASADKTARIWDARTGAQLAVLTGHQGRIESAAYSPDGTRIVTAATDDSIRVWDARTGTPVALLAAPGDRPVSAAFSPDGGRIVGASLNKTARIWDARTGDRLLLLSGHEDALQFAAYSPDGTRIVTVSRDKTARVWDANTGAALSVIGGHSEMLLSAGFSPDGTQVVTASADKTARIWDVRTGAQLVVLTGHGDRVFSAKYSPDGARIVTASDDRTARVWDARTGGLLAVLAGHGGFVRSAAFSPDGSRVVTASDDGTARIWLARNDTQLAVLSGHEGGVAFANYSPDGTRIVTASLDKTFRIWEAAAGTQLATFSGTGDYIIAASYSPDGKEIATGGSLDNTARIWDAGTGAQLAVLTGHRGPVESVAYSPDGGRIATASLDKTARIWDRRTGGQLALLSGHDDRVLSAVYSPDGRHVATASFDKTARIWDAGTGAEVIVLAGHSQAVSAAAYSPDGRWLVTASFDKTARVWDVRTGATIHVLTGHAGPLQAACFSPDGLRIVTASSDKTARIWDAHTGAQLAVLSGHQDSLQSAVYSPDGSRILTASMDRSARMWDARAPATAETQILWYAAAATDPLPDADRAELGLMPDARTRPWPEEASPCDRDAGAFYDPDRRSRGVMSKDIAVDIATPVCSAEIGVAEHSPRSDYQMGRVLAAKGDVKGARPLLETAAAKGYRAAGVDLADLLLPASQGVLDPGRAVSLYESALQRGVTAAAFRLGHLYEYGLQDRGIAVRDAFRLDKVQAWVWYQHGADLGEPSALARLAEREENAALAATDPSQRNAAILKAFSLYAAAAERARAEDWPDDAWKHWRYRRASLARLLAQQGMMQQVAAAYSAMSAKYFPAR